MSPEAVAAAAAVAAVLVTVLGGMAMLIWKAGRHSQRLDTAEQDIRSLRTTQEEHSRAIGAWDQALKLLEEVRHDVKNLLTGRVRPAQRRSAGD